MHIPVHKIEGGQWRTWDVVNTGLRDNTFSTVCNKSGEIHVSLDSFINQKVFQLGKAL